MFRIGGLSYPPALKAISGAGYAARYLGQYMPVKKAITLTRRFFLWTAPLGTPLTTWLAHAPVNADLAFWHCS